MAENTVQVGDMVLVHAKRSGSAEEEHTYSMVIFKVTAISPESLTLRVSGVEEGAAVGLARRIQRTVRTNVDKRMLFCSEQALLDRVAAGQEIGDALTLAPEDCDSFVLLPEEKRAAILANELGEEELINTYIKTST